MSGHYRWVPRMALRSDAHLSRVIGHIYDAALEPSAWSHALRECGDLLDGAAMQLYAIDTTTRRLLFQFDYGIPKRFSEEYFAYFSRESERNKLHVARPDIDVGYDYLFFDEREIDRHSCYRWRQEFGFRYYIGGPVFRCDDRMVLAALQRSPRQGHVAPAEIAAYRLLRPHLAQAVKIQNRLVDLNLRERSAWEAIENSDVGVIVLASDGRIRRCNREARRILAAGDGLIPAAEGLKARRSIDDAALQRLIADICTGTGESCGGSLAVAKRRSPRPYSLIVAPIRQHTEIAAFSGDRVLVLLSDPDRVPATPGDLLKRHYGLSKKEAALTMLLVGGTQLVEAAGELGIAESTARRHLASIFAKTDLHRQADLVRLVMSLPERPGAAD